jgi:hypothetical protein
MINLQDKLYTSTEVADILGVSLRSVYRYIEENKLVPEVKTATGRHRFTKQNIVDFLYPNGTEQRVLEDEESSASEKTSKAPIKTVKRAAIVEEAPKQVEEVLETPIQKDAAEEEPVTKEEVKQEAKEEPVDWLAKFREAAKKFEEESAPKEERVVREEKAEVPTMKEKFTRLTAEEEKPTTSMLYYRSRLGGLKDIAQNIEKGSKNSGLDYAFTMNAGLSLHSPIKPFSLLHVYVRSKDRDFFERVLMLTPSDEENAQLCLIPSDDNKVYNTSMVVHGLTVVAKDKLLNDIREMDTEGSLAKEAESILG